MLRLPCLSPNFSVGCPCGPGGRAAACRAPPAMATEIEMRVAVTSAIALPWTIMLCPVGVPRDAASFSMSGAGALASA